MYVFGQLMTCCVQRQADVSRILLDADTEQFLEISLSQELSNMALGVQGGLILTLGLRLAALARGPG